VRPARIYAFCDFLTGNELFKMLAGVDMDVAALHHLFWPGSPEWVNRVTLFAARHGRSSSDSGHAADACSRGATSVQGVRGGRFDGDPAV
jgi:hypothetical protein